MFLGDISVYRPIPPHRSNICLWCYLVVVVEQTYRHMDDISKGTKKSLHSITKRRVMPSNSVTTNVKFTISVTISDDFVTHVFLNYGPAFWHDLDRCYI